MLKITILVTCMRYDVIGYMVEQDGARISNLSSLLREYNRNFKDVYLHIYCKYLTFHLDPPIITFNLAQTSLVLSLNTLYKHRINRTAVKRAQR